MFWKSVLVLLVSFCGWEGYAIQNNPATSCITCITDGPVPAVESAHLTLARQLGFKRIRSGEVAEVLALETKGRIPAMACSTADKLADLEHALAGSDLQAWRTEQVMDVMPQFLIERGWIQDTNHWFFSEWTRQLFRGELYFMPGPQKDQVRVVGRIKIGEIPCARAAGGCPADQLPNRVKAWLYKRSQPNLRVSDVRQLKADPRSSVIFTALVSTHP